MIHAVKYLLFTAGLAGVVYGAWLIYRPVGWVLGGLLLVLLALLVDKQADTR